VDNEKKSAMPVFTPEKLSDADLDDLLAYLESLQGTSAAPANAR
jgi:mono/diheme cytochrome c family protein